MLQNNILSRFTKKTEIINSQKRSNTMRNKTSQSGFTLIELIAVMVILGILAAVIIPRITTLTSGAYESNVRSMYGVIKNEVQAQSIKAAMSGGAGGHREQFPLVDAAKAANFYLDEWVGDYDADMWEQPQAIAGAAAALANTNKVDAAYATPDLLIFNYMPHGVTSTDVTDKYHIYYMPITTLWGENNGIDVDGYVMFATRDLDQDGVGDARGTIEANGTFTFTANGDEEIADLTFITNRASDGI